MTATTMRTLLLAGAIAATWLGACDRGDDDAARLAGEAAALYHQALAAEETQGEIALLEASRKTLRGLADQYPDSNAARRLIDADDPGDDGDSGAASSQGDRVALATVERRLAEARCLEDVACFLDEIVQPVSRIARLPYFYSHNYAQARRLLTGDLETVLATLERQRADQARDQVMVEIMDWLIWSEQPDQLDDMRTRLRFSSKMAELRVRCHEMRAGLVDDAAVLAALDAPDAAPIINELVRCAIHWAGRSGRTELLERLADDYASAFDDPRLALELLLARGDLDGLRRAALGDGDDAQRTMAAAMAGLLVAHTSGPAEGVAFLKDLHRDQAFASGYANSTEFLIVLALFLEAGEFEAATGEIEANRDDTILEAFAVPMLAYYLARQGDMRRAIAAVDELMAKSDSMPELREETRLWSLLAAAQGLALRDAEGAVCSTYHTGLCPFL